MKLLDLALTFALLPAFAAADAVDDLAQKAIAIRAAYDASQNSSSVCAAEDRYVRKEWYAPCSLLLILDAHDLSTGAPFPSTSESRTLMQFCA